jgi:MoaA/NifB/PqqE/SkfB family radical SAM enzyme
MNPPRSGPPRIALDREGFFSRGGERLVPVGVNYWPASCGVEMWQAWPEDEIRHDLDVVRDLGLNCVRFFLRWQEFEPAEGRYDGTALFAARGGNGQDAGIGRPLPLPAGDGWCHVASRGNERKAIFRHARLRRDPRLRAARRSAFAAIETSSI